MVLYIIGWLINAGFYLLAVSVACLIIAKIYVTVTKVTCTCTTKLDGKVVIVTGANTGIGYFTAKRFAKHGARVVIASRNIEKSREAAEKMSRETGNPLVVAKTLDLSNLASVTKFVEDFNRCYDRLDILINNAGYVSGTESFTKDGMESTIQVNHVSPAYLTYLLLDKMIASKSGRIVFVSSGLYRIHQFDPNDLRGKAGGSSWIRYGNSKFCNILCAKALAKRLPEGITANAVHPGTTDSDIWENVPSKLAKNICYVILKILGKTCEECAQTSIHVALSPNLTNTTGLFFDDCRVTPLHRQCTDELALKVWDDTINLAKEIVSSKTD